MRVQALEAFADMLKTIDILLGVTIVMLIVSMCVTMLTQAATHVLDTRGKKLLEGLSDLLQQIDPSLERRITDGIASTVLRHPLINDGSRNLGSTILREEFTGMLLALGAGNVPASVKEHATSEVKAAITKLLKDHGIDNPEQTLENVRGLALHLERANPEMATNERQALAMMQEVRAQLVGKVNGWFDQTMDRVSARFTAHARTVTVMASIAVAFALQLDLVSLVNRLNVDPALRQALVEHAVRVAGTTSADSSEQAMQRLEQLTGQSKTELQSLVQIGAVTLPGKDWIQNWGYACDAKPGEKCPKKVNLIGVILSALLLSLGAPFWYNALKNIVRLRSLIAGKDDAQREARQSTQAPATGAAAPNAAATLPPSQVLVGERGILG
jgi:hypothetical protein